MDVLASLLKELESKGVEFKTEKETQVFVEVVQYELELRIGEAISKGVSDELLNEFDKCSTPEEAKGWLEKYRPDYKSVVLMKVEEMKDEILDNIDLII